MNAREFFAASGRSESDTLRVGDLIGYEEAKGNAPADLKGKREETKVATQDDIDRVARGGAVGGEGGGATAHRDAGTSSAGSARKGGARARR